MADDSGANPQLPSLAKPDAPATEGAVTAPPPPAPAETTAAKSVAGPTSAAVEPPAEAKAAATPSPGDQADVEMAGTAEDAPVASAAPVAGAASEPASAGAAGDAPSPAPAADDAAVATPGGGKSKVVPKARRKSTGPSSAKKLNRKGSKAKIRHTDAQPGDHFFLKLKGYPTWPVIVCDEEMLPSSLIAKRPVGAAGPDGTYRADFADGGKRAGDRWFPVMYLFTNEFGWAPNTDLRELDPATVTDSVNDRMKAELKGAFALAAESNPLGHYKEELKRWQREKEERELAAAEASAKKPKKGKAAAAEADDEDEDVDMDDAGDAEEPAAKKSKKRKADDDATIPQRSDSVKKPKIKITSSGGTKTSNGVPTPKSAKSTEAKPAKSKVKKEGKTAEDKKAEKEAQVPKEPELSPEEKHQRKEKEVLFLRHKLQKGLLTRDQEPKAEEMKAMSEFITKLEGFPSLEVSIIRATKINKVLKAILKLESIPKEDEFRFKPRSQELLEKWNKILAAADLPAPAANGVNGTAGDGAAGKTPEAADAAKAQTTNGVKEKAAGTKAVQPAEAPETEAKEEEPVVEEPAKAPEPAEAKAVESAA